MPTTEAMIPIQIKRDPLKEPLQVEQPKTTPFEHLELVVQAFDKPAGRMGAEIVRNGVEPGIQQLQEWVEAPQPTPRNPLPPPADAPESIRLRPGRIEDAGQ